MATWKWGPIECTQEHTERKIKYDLEYNTVADGMGLYRTFLSQGIYYDEKLKLNEREYVFGADYDEYNAICTLIVKCFLGYTMGYDSVMIDKLLDRTAMIVDRPVMLII